MSPAARREAVQESRPPHGGRQQSCSQRLPKLRLLAIVRVLATQASCCRLSGRVAQLVEQGIENPRVGGSIPSSATISKPSSARLPGSHRICCSPVTASILRALHSLCVACVRACADVIQRGRRLARWFGHPFIRVGPMCTQCNRFRRGLQMRMAILRA